MNNPDTVQYEGNAGHEKTENVVAFPFFLSRPLHP
jgi:hypothetical protein